MTVPAPANRPRGGPQAPVTLADGAHRAERTLLYLLLQNPGLFRKVETELGAEPFEDPHHRQVYAEARALQAEGRAAAEGPLLTRVLDRLSDPEVRLVLTEMAAKPMLTSDPEKEAADCIEKIRKHRDSRRIEALTNLIRAAEASKQTVDPAIVLELTALMRKNKPSRS